MLTSEEVSTWFDTYNDTFGACGRGEVPVTRVVDLYGPGMVITTGDGVIGPGTEEAATWVDAQTSTMRQAGYSHTEILRRRVTVINASTAILEGDFSRCALDGSEVSAFTVTYVIYNADARLRIGSLAIHST